MVMKMTEPTVVTVHVAKTTLSKLIERAEHGEEIIIARGKLPAVTLTPVRPPVKREFGLYRGVASVGPEFFEPLPEDELRAWETGE
jgi:antitoxin (DNA-binding transcriptional repressor) of toxin-antitoxin stability system